MQHDKELPTSRPLLDLLGSEGFCKRLEALAKELPNEMHPPSRSWPWRRVVAEVDGWAAAAELLASAVLASLRQRSGSERCQDGSQLPAGVVTDCWQHLFPAPPVLLQLADAIQLEELAASGAAAACIRAMQSARQLLLALAHVAQQRGMQHELDVPASSLRLWQLLRWGAALGSEGLGWGLLEEAARYMELALRLGLGAKLMGWYSRSMLTPLGLLLQQQAPLLEAQEPRQEAGPAQGWLQGQQPAAAAVADRALQAAHAAAVCLLLVLQHDDGLQATVQQMRTMLPAVAAMFGVPQLASLALRLVEQLARPEPEVQQILAVEDARVMRGLAAALQAAAAAPACGGRAAGRRGSRAAWQRQVGLLNLLRVLVQGNAAAKGAAAAVVGRAVAAAAAAMLGCPEAGPAGGKAELLEALHVLVEGSGSLQAALAPGLAPVLAGLLGSEEDAVANGAALVLAALRHDSDEARRVTLAAAQAAAGVQVDLSS